MKTQIHNKRHFPFSDRAVAIFLSVSLVLSNGIGYAGSATSSLRSGGPDTVEVISIPDEFGKIEESFLGTSGKMIIYIQDAHDSLEAQENIAKTIHYLVDKYGVKTVYEEGYEGPVPTDKYFRTIQDPKIREKVAYFLMDKIRIGGAEYAHITRTKDFKLIGADSLKLHRKNIEVYQKSARHQKETENDLNTIDTAIRKLAQKYFTNDLKKWMEIKGRFDHQKIDLLDYLKRTVSLQDCVLGKGKIISSYPVISLLLASEKSNDSMLFKNGKRIDAKILFEEINQLEDDYARSQLKEKRDREIFRYYKMIQLLKRLNGIEVTKEEYEAVKANLKEIDTEEIAQFLVAQNHKSVVLSKAWEAHIQSAIEFYEVAHERDASIRNCLKEYRKNEGKEPTVLVYGGFHKGSIKELLSESGLSYSIVMPKIGSVSPKHQEYYKQLMQMGYDTIALPAFVTKATRAPDLLAFTLSGPRSEARVHRMINQIEKIAVIGKDLDEMDLVWARDQAKQDEKYGFTSYRSEVRKVFKNEEDLVNALEKRERIIPEDPVNLVNHLWGMNGDIKNLNDLSHYRGAAGFYELLLDLSIAHENGFWSIEVKKKGRGRPRKGLFAGKNFYDLFSPETHQEQGWEAPILTADDYFKGIKLLEEDLKKAEGQREFQGESGPGNLGKRVGIKSATSVWSQFHEKKLTNGKTVEESFKWPSSYRLQKLSRSEMREAETSFVKAAEITFKQEIIFVDGSISSEHAKAQVEELAVLAASDPKRLIIIYNTDKLIFQDKGVEIAELLKSFDLINVKFVAGSLVNALRPYQFRSNFDLVHYAMSEKSSFFVGTSMLHGLADRLIRFVGEPGALGYGLKHLQAVKLHKPVEDIQSKNGYYLVSSRASESMRLLQEAQFVTVFSQSA